MAKNPYEIFTDKKVGNGKMLAVQQYVIDNYGELTDTPTPFYTLAFGTTLFNLPPNQVLYIERTDVIALAGAPNITFSGDDGLGNIYNFAYNSVFLPIVLNDIFLQRVISEENVQYQSVKGWLFTFEDNGK